jgi:hypothetical protein
MRCVHLVAPAVLTIAVASHACLSPINIEGVAFTDGEKIDLEVLTAMGEEGVNYVIDGDKPHIAVRYISHYDPEAIVYVGTYGLSYQQGVRMNCMGLILPMEDGQDPFESLERSEFDFAAAVRAELQWLVDHGVVDLDSAARAVIDSALSAATNGGVQYWTHARTVLGYNSWYEYDEQSGTWAGSEGAKGEPQAVRGVDAVNGCSVVEPGEEQPTEPLGSSMTGRRGAVMRRCRESWATATVRRGTIVLELTRPAVTGGEAILFTPRGEVVARYAITPGRRTVSLAVPPTTAAGNYLTVVVNESGSRRMMVPLTK